MHELYLNIIIVIYIIHSILIHFMLVRVFMFASSYVCFNYSHHFLCFSTKFILLTKKLHMRTKIHTCATSRLVLCHVKAYPTGDRPAAGSVYSFSDLFRYKDNMIDPGGNFNARALFRVRKLSIR